MPKDWIGHKAELKRLYITEGKGLAEIKDIFESRGFKASTRSYRTRLHDWGFLKSHSKKSRRTAKATARSSDHSDGFQTPFVESNEIPVAINMPTQDEIRSMDSSRSSSPQASVQLLSDLPSSLPREYGNIFIGEYTVPGRRIDPKELESFVPVHDCLYLYFLLVKWQQGGKYMKALRKILQKKNNCKLIFEPADDVWIKSDPSAVDEAVEWRIEHLFMLVDHFVSVADRYEVTKLLLSLAGLACNSKISWIVKWSLAKTCHNWELTKGLLESSAIEFAMSSLFVRAGKVVLAENLLKHFQQSYDGENICQRCMNYEPVQYRRRCMQILDSFSDVESATFDVDCNFYRLSFLIVDGAEENVFVRLEKARELEMQNLLDENHKCRQVISKLGGIAPEEVDGRLEDLLDLTQDGVSGLPRKELEKATKIACDSINNAAPYTQAPPAITRSVVDGGFNKMYLV